MLRFLVGTAVRTAARSAARAAVNSHYDGQARAAAQREAQLRAGPWALVPCPPVGETAVYQESRCGFTHAVPGFPQLIAPIPTPTEPAIDGLVALGDAPIWVRYRLDRPNVRAANAMDAAVQLAQMYATNRTGFAQAVAPARADRIQSYAVEAAAIAAYMLPGPDPFGADTEELTVLVRDGAALAVTVRYPKTSLDWVHKAMFDSVTNATLHWQPQSGPSAPIVWPDSTFLEPGLLTVLKAHRQQLLSQIGPTLGSLSQPEKEALSTELGALILRDEPPWHALPPDALGGIARGLMNTTQNPSAQAIFHQAVGEVRTAHDARGLAVWLGRAMN